jgi:GntR family transcriptional regulator of arabinose operon
MPIPLPQKSVITKHARLSDELRQQILSGELQPGDRLPSITEFKARYGITKTTIEKVMGTLESEGMIERFHGKGMFVAPKRKTSKTIGFVSSRTGKPDWSFYWSQVLEGLQEGAYAAGYDVLLINPDLSSSWPDKVDGIVLHEVSEKLIKSHSPKFINLVSNLSDAPFVVADDFGGGYSAAKHLLELGHRSIAYIVDTCHRETQMRLAGYHAALADFNVCPSSGWIRYYKEVDGGDGYKYRGAQEMADWLATDWHDQGCTALICQNDLIAIGAMKALQEKGIRIPQDVSLVGYDGTTLAETTYPKLTSVKVPLHGIGVQAASMIIEYIETGTASTTIKPLPTSLQVRDSTCCPRTNIAILKEK